MSERMNRYLLLLVLCASAGSGVEACTKPVFRYALERWPAAPYRLAVLHRGPIDDAKRAPLDALLPEGTYSFVVEHMDVEKELPKGLLRDVWAADPDPARLPLGVLLPPANVQIEQQVLWQGRVDTSGVEMLRRQLYGPLTQQLLRRLASGDTAVWILLKGSDEAENREARERLEKSLGELKDQLKLPHEQDPDDTVYDDDLAPGIPMRMNFSVLETDLKHPGDGLFKASLKVIAGELLEQPGPKVVPVFARCRGLAVLHGDEIDPEVFEEICYFLVGPCSCRVKDLNPGFDLPAPFPWDWVLYEETELETVMRSLPRPVAGKDGDDGATR